MLKWSCDPPRHNKVLQVTACRTPKNSCTPMKTMAVTGGNAYSTHQRALVVVRLSVFQFSRQLFSLLGEIPSIHPIPNSCYCIEGFLSSCSEINWLNVLWVFCFVYNTVYFFILIGASWYFLVSSAAVTWQVVVSWCTNKKFHCPSYFDIKPHNNHGFTFSR